MLLTDTGKYVVFVGPECGLCCPLLLNRGNALPRKLAGSGQAWQGPKKACKEEAGGGEWLLHWPPAYMIQPFPFLPWSEEKFLQTSRGLHGC